MKFFSNLYSSILSFIEGNWFGMAYGIRLFVLAVAMLGVIIFGLASFRACDLNWGAL